MPSTFSPLLPFLTLILLAHFSGGVSCSDWCVASNEAPDSVIQKALDWVCLYGSACNRIKVGLPCYEAGSLRAVATVAFNQYWQQVKQGGTHCDLFGAATLVHTDPSRENCTIPCV
ncbi:hypothetical protein RND81_06G144000 [Saponaria officinalis]|uniref:X8 domain-containing protein n=1 Tax=Saponaria officinalis TaxID=3572 RepID=A0AAW1KBQ4_SAPOF